MREVIELMEMKPVWDPFSVTVGERKREMREREREREKERERGGGGGRRERERVAMFWGLKIVSSEATQN